MKHEANKITHLMRVEADILGNELPRIPAANFCATLAKNVDNDALTDAEFREFVRRTLPIVGWAKGGAA